MVTYPLRMGDPTAVELLSFTTVELVAAHAQIGGMHADRTSVLGSLFSALGLEPNTLPAVIGVVSEADFDTAITTWQIVTALDGDGNPTARRAPTLAAGQGSFLCTYLSSENWS